MHCSYLSHGLAFGYSQSVKPCCEFKTDNKWQKDNNIQNVDFVKYHNSLDIENIKNILGKNQWPKNCIVCENIEKKGITESLRQIGNISYKHYNKDDITLEIRPGITCNFSCQTCWPGASSKVMQHYMQANLINQKIKNHKIDNFEFLNPIKDRIKHIIVLGGEPFYDKNCLNFINYAKTNLKANLTIFTNGSKIDYQFIKNYKGNLKLVFSIDAIGKISEYIRFGSNWDDVNNNYQNCVKIKNITTCANITLSVYNVHLIHETIEYFLQHNLDVNFGFANELHFKNSIIPHDLRKLVIENLKIGIKKILNAKISKDQKLNSLHVLKHVLFELENDEWDKSNLVKWQDFVKKMDSVKKINIENYNSFLSQLLNYQIN